MFERKGVPKEIKMQPCGSGVNWDEIYPENSSAKILNRIVDPFKEIVLERGTLVTIKKMNYKPNNTWITCLDQYDNSWSVRPRDIELINKPTKKLGRFKILAQD